MLDVNPSLLRFWESRFSIIKPHKNKKGNRLFTPGDVENLKLIYHLVKEKGMTLAGAEKALKKGGPDVARDAELYERLVRIRSLLVEIREELKAGDGELVDYPAEDETAAATPAYARESQELQEPQETAATPWQTETPDGTAAQPQTVREAEPQTETTAKPLPRIVEQTLF